MLSQWSLSLGSQTLNSLNTLLVINTNDSPIWQKVLNKHVSQVFVTFIILF